MSQDFIIDYLENYYDELTPKEFYRNIFPVGSLGTKGIKEQGKYNAIALELIKKKSKNEITKVNRFIVNDDLEIIDDLIKSDNFIILSPISYIGASRKSKNARYIFAITIDLDGIDTKQHLADLFFQIKNDYLPNPTYISASGSGVHLYYQLEPPLQCYEEITKELSKLKDALTKKIWNVYTTTLYSQIQIESLFQGFRMIGTITKNNKRVRVFETGNKVDVEYLNSFVYDGYRANLKTKRKKKSKYTLEKAKELFPEWYEERILNEIPAEKNPHWICKRDLYDWWKKRITFEATEGHRYFCIMCLAVYAKKCNIPKEELEKDAFELLERMDRLTTRENNKFDEEDILSALEMYNDNYFTFPIDTIKKISAIDIQKNKRNFRTRKKHLELLNQERMDKKNEYGIIRNTGRKSKKDDIEAWQLRNPNGTIKECIKETGIGRSTIYRYWKKEETENV